MASCFRQVILFTAVLFVSTVSSLRLRGQEYMFTTLAGSGGPGAIDGPGLSARFNYPQGVAADAEGNVYVADSYNATIRKITTNGVVTTLAGLAPILGIDDGLGSHARFHLPAALAVDTNRNVFVADQYSHTIRKITSAGGVTTFAGTAGQAGANNGSGGAARFNFPGGLAVDRAGNLYVADTLNHTIRKITPAGEVTTLAGSAGSEGSDDGVGTEARFSFPRGVAVDSSGTVYVADTENQTIRKIAPDGTVSIMAGTVGQTGSSDGASTTATFNGPVSLAADSSGNLYVADSSNSTIRKVTHNGDVSTVTGDPTQPGQSVRPFISYADGLGNAARFKFPQGVAVDNLGNVYVADSSNDAVRRITSGGLVSTLAGSAKTGVSDGPGTDARFRHPTGVAVDKAGSLFVVDGDNFTIRQISPAGMVTTIAGVPDTSGNADGLGPDARFSGPRKLAVNSAGDLFVADTGNSTIRKLTQGQQGWEVKTFAGQAGVPGFGDGTGTAALFNALYDVATDGSNNLYVADKDNQVIRKVSPDGVVTTFAGMAGAAGAADGLAEQARFNRPYGIAVDSAGFIYLADTLNHTIRKVTPEGLVTTLAGKAGEPGSADGQGDIARFNAPYGVAVDGGGNVYVVDYLNNLIRKITSAGLVTTLAGQLERDANGNPLNGSADGSGTAARFYNPKGIAVDKAGTLYVADSFSNTIRLGTTNSCPDQATIDQPEAQIGQERQLDTTPQTAVAWQWSLIRRPANSRAALSGESLRNPTFTPDVPDAYLFQLRATNASGAICVRTVSLSVAAPAPIILASSATLTNGQFSFTFEGMAGVPVQVEVSDNFKTWLPLGTFPNETGTFTIIDIGPDLLRGFYRLRQL